MTNRRDFIRYAGIAAAAANLPAVALPAQQEKRLVRLIPGSDEELPVIGLGNSAAFRDQDLGVARNLIRIFLEHGGGYVDAGGGSRFSVGRIGSDLGAPGRLFMGNYVDPRDLDAMREEAATVARAQGKDALDLAHTRNLGAYRNQVDNYRQLKEEGLVRYIGVARSGRRSFADIMRLIDDKLVDFVQVNYSPVEPEAGDALLPLAAEKGIAVGINRPFLNGRYFDIVGGRELPSWAADFDCESWAQFSLKFIASHPAVNCVLTETADPKHAVDNLGAGTGRLPDDATRQRMIDVIRKMV